MDSSKAGPACFRQNDRRSHAAEQRLCTEQNVIIEHFKVAMVTGGVAGGANLTDLVHLIDGLALSNCNAGHMRVQRFVAVAVVDLNVVAVRVMPASRNDRTGVRCVDRRTVGSADICL